MHRPQRQTHFTVKPYRYTEVLYLIVCGLCVSLHLWTNIQGSANHARHVICVDERWQDFNMKQTANLYPSSPRRLTSGRGTRRTEETEGNTVCEVWMQRRAAFFHSAFRQLSSQDRTNDQRQRPIIHSQTGLAAKQASQPNRQNGMMTQTVLWTMEHIARKQRASGGYLIAAP